MADFPQTGLTVRLVTSADSAFTNAGRIEGALDVPLSPRGRESMRRLSGEVLGPAGSGAVIYSAPNQGSRETAEILAEAGDGRVRVLAGLRGISCGLWEGLPVSEVRLRHRRSFGRWRDDPFCLTPPRGEEMVAATGRIASALRRILKKHRSGLVVVVAPAPVIEVGYRELNGVDGQGAPSVRGGVPLTVERTAAGR